VCSKRAESDPSSVTTVQSSGRTVVCRPPRLTIGSTETAASIVCDDYDQNTPGLDPKDPSIAGDNDPGEDGLADGAFDDTNETFTNLPPGTYDCRVVIDP